MLQECPPFKPHEEEDWPDSQELWAKTYLHNFGYQEGSYQTWKTLPNIRDADIRVILTTRFDAPWKVVSNVDPLSLPHIMQHAEVKTKENTGHQRARDQEKRGQGA